MKKSRLDEIRDMYLNKGCRMALRGGIVLDLLQHIDSLEAELNLVRASNAHRGMVGTFTQVKARSLIDQANEMRARRERE